MLEQPTTILTHPASSVPVIGGSGGMVEIDSSIPPMPAFKAAVAAMRAGSADARVLCIGDSTTAGSRQANNIPIPAYSAWPFYLVSKMEALGFTSAPGLAIPPAGATQDARWTVGTGWSRNNYSWGGQGSFTATNPAGSLIFTPPAGYSCDGFRFMCLKNGGQGIITITATGGTPVVINAGALGGANQYVTTAMAASAGTSNTLTITATGTVYVTGVEPILTTTKKLLIGNAGVPGSTALWNSAGGFNSVQAITVYDPDLCIISLGTNDANTGTAKATVKTNLQTLITASVNAGANVVLSTMPPTTAGSTLTKELEYVDAYKELALSNNVPLVNLFDRWGGYTAGFMEDNTHPNNAGHDDWATAFSTVLKSVG